MSEYVPGVLVRNEHGAAAPGSSHPVDRWLVVQTSSQKTLRIFDDTHLPPTNLLLSEQSGIMEGRSYDFIVIALAQDVVVGTSQGQAAPGRDMWQGTIVQATWQLPAQPYLAADPNDINQYGGILVETVVGRIIMPYDAVGDEDNPPTLRHGDTIQWDNIRFSLLAIARAE